MAGRVSVAEATWEGDLLNGSGRVSSASGAVKDVTLTWTSRVEPTGKASPEELLAAAHAGCFSMAFSNVLAQGGHVPERLDVRASCTFDKGPAGKPIRSMQLEVEGDVPGIDQDEFRRAAAEAKDGCPVSQAFEGNLEITVEARLTSAAR